MKKEALATLIMLFVSSGPAQADWITDYVRYTDSAELGQIVIESGRVRGQNSVRCASNSMTSLSSRNVFVGAGSTDRVYRRTSKHGRHVISTTITLHPPGGVGYGGGNYQAELSLKIDGEKKVHCNLGYLASENNLHVEKIVIYPEDEYIEVVATAGMENRRVSPPLKHCLFEDAHVISNLTLAYAGRLSMRSSRNF